MQSSEAETLRSPLDGLAKVQVRLRFSQSSSVCQPQFNPNFAVGMLFNTEISLKNSRVTQSRKTVFSVKLF